MEKQKRDFYAPSTDPDGSYTGTRKPKYGEVIIPGLVPADEIPNELPDEKPVQDVDDL